MLIARRPVQQLVNSLRVGETGAGRPRTTGRLLPHTSLSRWLEPGLRRFGRTTSRWQETVTTRAAGTIVDALDTLSETTSFAKGLPVVCPGCGALSQTVEPKLAGFYSQKKRNVKVTKMSDEDEVFQEAMARVGGVEESDAQMSEQQSKDTSTGLICDRCHDLLYQSKGSSILHPSMQSIQEIIEASPHKHNHIYHVLDAADFPMSLIPNLMSALKLPRLRTQNRRSKTRTYVGDRVADISFIITRSDLLAPKKEQVDRLLPYLQDVLRDALGRTGRNVRLGNVRCVSAKRGWWTPQVKEEIWKRGGAGWVVGKVNVGKSALFEVVYPKGRNFDAVETARREVMRSSGASHQQGLSASRDAFGVMESASSSYAPFHDDQLDQLNSTLATTGEQSMQAQERGADEHRLDAVEDQNDIEEEEEDSVLLPPAQPETQYPQMPIVSALPGTTASPIRIPYGNGRGELIDLPGVQRSSLETHVAEEHRASLLMKSRVVPEQHSLKPGQSLLIGGIVRITPKTDDLVFLAYSFTALKAHSTSNQKAMAIQTGVNEDGTPYTGNVENIGTDKAKLRIKSAGVFTLDWDVTKKRAGPMTDKQAGKLKADNLPFIVYSADILIEGVGWVELVCQVRRRRHTSTLDVMGPEADALSISSEPKPEVEVFTPKGKFVGIRKPMNAWIEGGPKKVAKHARRGRPRMTISMQKRKEGGRKGGHLANATPS